MSKNKPVRVLFVVGDELVAEMEFVGDGGEGSRGIMNWDTTIRANYLMGWCALATAQAISTYVGTGEAGEHWRDFEPMLMDVLEKNELAITAELLIDGLLDKGDMVQ